MKISNNCIVSIHYTLTNDEGQELDTSTGGEPLRYLHGSANIVSGLEGARKPGGGRRAQRDGATRARLWGCESELDKGHPAFGIQRSRRPNGGFGRSDGDFEWRSRGCKRFVFLSLTFRERGLRGVRCSKGREPNTVVVRRALSY